MYGYRQNKIPLGSSACAKETRGIDYGLRLVAPIGLFFLKFLIEEGLTGFKIVALRNNDLLCAANEKGSVRA